MHRIHYVILLILIVSVLGFIAINNIGGRGESSLCRYLRESYGNKYGNISLDRPCSIDSDCQILIFIKGPCHYPVPVAKSKLDIFNGRQNDLYISLCQNNIISCGPIPHKYNRTVCENSICVGR